jgi:hypothetical protein
MVANVYFIECSLRIGFFNTIDTNHTAATITIQNPNTTTPSIKTRRTTRKTRTIESWKEQQTTARAKINNKQEAKNPGRPVSPNSHKEGYAVLVGVWGPFKYVASSI